MLSHAVLQMAMRPRGAEDLLLQRELNSRAGGDAGARIKCGFSPYSCRAQMALPLLLANQALNPPDNRAVPPEGPCSTYSHPVPLVLLLQAPGPSPDHHLDGVDANAQAPLLGDHVGNPATAVADLRVKVHPLPRRWLGHDVDVHLGTARLRHPQQDRPSTGTSHPSPFGRQQGWSCSHPLHFTDLS